MKQERGITLISLTVYIIVMTIVIAVVGVVSGAFVKSMKSTKSTTDPITEYTAFNSYFSDEINHKGIQIRECNTNYIVFSNGVQYTFVNENSGIYRNYVKIAKDVEECIFKENIKNGKTVVDVKIKVGNKVRTTTYTLK